MKPKCHPCQSKNLPGAACVPDTAFCARCNRATPTVFLNLRSGMIANTCGVCRSCRKGRPYVGRWDSEQQHRDAGATGQGAHHEQHTTK